MQTEKLLVIHFFLQTGINQQTAFVTYPGPNCVDDEPDGAGGCIGDGGDTGYQAGVGWGHHRHVGQVVHTQVHYQLILELEYTTQC